jgi:hypothetical protein
VARRATIEAFERWIADSANVEALLDLVADGATLRNAAFALKQPYTCVHAYLHSTPELVARYEAARKSWADVKMDEALDIADAVPADKDEVAKAKLQVETRQVQAKAYYSGRWGERIKVEKSVTVGVDTALLSSVDELLRLANEKVVESLPAQLPRLEHVEDAD